MQKNHCKVWHTIKCIKNNMKKYIKESSLVKVCTLNGNKYDKNAH